jgi:hypothetical protein
MRVVDPPQESTALHPDIHLVEHDAPVGFRFFEIVDEYTQGVEMLSHDTGLSCLAVEKCTSVVFVILPFL